MSLLDQLERRFGFLAIPRLPRILVGFAALVFGLTWLLKTSGGAGYPAQTLPDFTSMLTLDPGRILHGEVWRLITYIFIPQATSPLWVLFALWFLWWVGEGLERAWGSFRLTLYFLVGMIGTTVAAFFFGSDFSNRMLLMSLFLGFAHFYPEEIIYILFILPVRIKWLAWISGAFLLFGFFTNSNSYRAALIAALANYLIFFGPEFIYRARHRQEVSSRKKRFEDQTRSETEPLHKCAVCGATELTDPNLDFRVASDGEEYCVAHLPSAQTATR